MPRIQLLVVQPTPFCNIDCRYCYLPDRTNKAVVADETLATCSPRSSPRAGCGDGLSVVWHAGEPMVLPIDFYRRAFRLIDGLKPPDLTVTHSFQTNGTLIDDAWCEFFAEEQRQCRGQHRRAAAAARQQPGDPLRAAAPSTRRSPASAGCAGTACRFT